jgi:nascent polypeptide-associated complex subunit alpha
VEGCREVFGLSPRELKRQMKRLGINMDVEEIPEARRVVVELPDKDLVVDEPQVVLMRIQGQTMIYVSGSVREESRAVVKEAGEQEISDEDVQLVASQAGVSMEEARAALKATGGDLAQAIMLLEARKKE